MTELYILPDGCAGTWWVYEAGTSAPLSQHGNVNDAEAAAIAEAGHRLVDRVTVFDRYHRTRSAPPRRRSAARA
jgi:hypothetical protein